MEDVILIIAVAAVMVFGFFIMKRLDVFLKENKKAIEKKREECSPLEFIDSENYENMTCIENFKKSHKKAAIIVFDKENREFTNVLTDYMSRK